MRFLSALAVVSFVLIAPYPSLCLARYVRLAILSEHHSLHFQLGRLAASVAPLFGSLP